MRLVPEMDYIWIIFKQTTSLLISLGLIAVLSFILREWIKRFIDYSFKQKEYKAGRLNNVATEIENLRIPMSIELSELAYRTRNNAREIVNNNTPITPLREEFSQCSFLLTERLYKYRILLDEDIFDKLHKFKRLAQDFLIYIDSSDRPEDIQNGILTFPQEKSRKLHELYQEMDSLHGSIKDYFDNQFNSVLD